MSLPASLNLLKGALSEDPAVPGSAFFSFSMISFILSPGFFLMMLQASSVTVPPPLSWRFLEFGLGPVLPPAKVLRVRFFTTRWFVTAPASGLFCFVGFGGSQTLSGTGAVRPRATSIKASIWPASPSNSALRSKSCFCTVLVMMFDIDMLQFYI